MRVAVDEWNYTRSVMELVNYVNALPPGTIVISGGARGVDKTAEDAARARGLEVEIYPADWSLGKGAGMIRNKTIVDRAEKLGVFWDGVSPGTKSTLGMAKTARKPVELKTTHRTEQMLLFGDRED